jgi:hypothetical protein
VDLRNLLLICLSQCRDKQEALSNGETYDNRHSNYEGSEVKHHGDIFEIEKSSKDCRLCEVIFQAFTRTNIQDAEVARGLQIIFRASCSKIEVCYNTDAKGGLVKLCGLDVYMDEPDGEYYPPNNCVMELIFLCSRRTFRSMSNKRGQFAAYFKDNGEGPCLQKII